MFSPNLEDSLNPNPILVFLQGLDFLQIEIVYLILHKIQLF